MHGKRLGLAAVIIVNLIWSGSFAATAIAVTHMSSVTLTMVRLGTGALVLSPYLRLPKGMRWDRSTLGLAILLGIVGFTAPVYLETAGLALSTPAMAAISIALEPLFTIVIATLMLRERLPKLRIIALWLALIGAWAIAGFPRPGAAGYLWGDLLLILAVLCYGVYNAYSKHLTARVPPTSGAAVTLLAGFLTTLPIWLVDGAPWPSAMPVNGYLAIAYLTLMATALAYFLWLSVLQRISVSVAALFLYLQPIFGVILSILIVHVHPPLGFYGGAALIFAALFIGRERPVTVVKASAVNTGNAPR